MNHLKKHSLIILCIIFAMMSDSVSTFARGRHVSIDHSKTSNVLIIGDSRIVMLSDVVNKFPKTKEKPSFNAVFGGHYVNRSDFIADGNLANSLVITHSYFLKEQKAIIKNCIKKHGSCIVVLEATINDIKPIYNFDKESVDRIAKFKKYIEKMTFTYKKTTRKTVYKNGRRKKVVITKTYKKHPTVIITSIIPEKNNEIRTTYANKLLKQKFGRRLINLGDEKEWKPYYRDRLHFYPAGSKLLYGKIMKAIKK